MLESEAKASENKGHDLSEAIEVEVEIAEIYEQFGKAEHSVNRYLDAIKMQDKLEKEQFDGRLFQKTANALLSVMQKHRVLAEVYEIGAEIIKLVEVYFP